MQNETTKSRYSDNELAEFKHLIESKIKMAREELNELASTLNASNTNVKPWRMALPLTKRSKPTN
jgi:DnaK suppressor protein